MSPAVSIITPAWNAQETIARTVASVRAQTFGDWELLVGDDGSEDGTADAAITAGSGDHRVRVVRFPRTGRPGPVRNRLLELSRGAWIAFLDADDCWAPRKLEAQLELLRRSRRRWSFGNARIAGAGRAQPSGLYYPRSWRPGCPFFPQLFTGDGVPCLTVVVERSLLEEAAEGRGIGAVIEESPDLPVMTDWEMALRLSLRAEPAYLAAPLATYHIVEGSVSRNAERNCRTALGFIARYRRRGIGSALCDRAERLHRSKLAVGRLFAGEPGWRSGLLSSCARLPVTPRDAFLAGIGLLPAAWARGTYRAALGMRRAG